MKILTVSLLAALAITGCRSSAPPDAYANPVAVCETKTTEEARRACMKDVVDTVSLAQKREKERRKAPPK